MYTYSSSVGLALVESKNMLNDLQNANELKWQQNAYNIYLIYIQTYT